MTAKIFRLTIPAMAKPGRRAGPRAEWRLNFIRKTREARERVELSQEEMAAELTRRSGRPIVADTYRKWEKEDLSKGALLPHDLIVHFCDVTQTHPYSLLGDSPFPSSHKQSQKRRAAA